MVYICHAKRTPIGSFLGELANISATQLGAELVKDLLKTNLNLAVDAVIMGNVLSAGVGQAPARQVGILGGLKNTFSALTVNKVCSSGLKAIEIGFEQIKLGKAEVVICGGIESMSNVPYLAPRNKLRLGDVQLKDGLINDGLWDPYNNFHMGCAGELCSREYKITREAQDNFALKSYKLAQEAINSGLFKNEILPFQVGKKLIEKDEEPFKSDLTKLTTLKPVFEKDGVITAGNASSLNDGAAILVLANDAGIKKNNLTPLARIIGFEENSHAPEWFTTAPIGALKKLLHNSGINIDKIDAFEINEAFSIVPIVCGRELGIDENKINQRGGAVALGHPLGVSGARIVVTLLNTLAQQEIGAVGICNGGGEAMAGLFQKV